MKLIIDADPIVYRSGFAGESTEYQAVLEDVDGSIVSYYFKPTADKTALQQLNEVAAKTGRTIAYKEKLIKAEPVANVLNIVYKTIVSIEDRVREQFKVAAKDLNTYIALSGPNNFRYKIATIKPYKGNRDPSHIPVHYQAIRDYLTNRWGARVIHGREADDECSIEGWKLWREQRRGPQMGLSSHSYVVASIDKDLDQIPGHHYDYMKHVFYFMTLDEAYRAFWIQVLAGDVVDNIPGLKGYGMVKAAAQIDYWIDNGLRDTDMWKEIVALYSTNEAALEIARLVYMQRRPGELWNPPGVPFGTIQGDADD